MNPQVWLPTALLVVAFLLKLFVDRRAAAPDLCFALFELPLDIAFLATSFVAGFTIANPPRASEGLVTLLVYVSAWILVVVVWRRCLSLFSADRFVRAGLLGTFNGFVCIWGLVRAVGLLGGP